MEMDQTITLSKVYKEILLLKRELDNLKKYVIDEDTIMTNDEEEEYEESLREFEEGKTFSLEQIKKDRKNA